VVAGFQAKLGEFAGPLALTVLLIPGPRTRACGGWSSELQVAETQDTFDEAALSRQGFNLRTQPIFSEDTAAPGAPPQGQFGQSDPEKTEGSVYRSLATHVHIFSYLVHQISL